ncbi:MAG: hypothetical protein WCG45_03955 [bacterium]
MAETVSNFLNRVVERNGFSRERYQENKVPTDFNDIIVFPFWGDVRSVCILSMLLLHHYKMEQKGSKYFIILSWPGFQGLFPYADEYWSISDESQIKNFYESSEEFRNKSELNTIFLRNLNEFFRDVVDYRDIESYYNNGFTNGFFERFKNQKRFLPFVPSSAILGKEFNRELATKAGYKVFIHPSLFAKQWFMGRSQNIKINKDFWIELVEFLLQNNFVPVIWQNALSYDISQDFIDRCIFLGEKDVSRALTAMRATGCVLDIFNGISRLAIMARCPFLCVDERIRFHSQKEYEIDDLCGKDIPKEYIYTFSTIVSDGKVENWKLDIFKSILYKLNDFIPLLDRDNWPSTGETLEPISYKNLVREADLKKIGKRFLKVPKI